MAAIAFGIGLLAALALSGGISILLSRRVRAIAEVAGRYAQGDLSRPARDYGNDESGTVARVLDESVREIGRRANDLASDATDAGHSLGHRQGVLISTNRDGCNWSTKRPAYAASAARRRRTTLSRDRPASGYRRATRYRAEGGRDQPARADASAGAGAHHHRAQHAGRGGGGRRRRLVMHDITDLRRADRIRRDFVANVSHELRTPLTAVRGYVEALTDGGTDQQEARRFLEIIGRHTLRMERLVRDLLRLARLDAGQELLEHVACSTSRCSGVENELAPASSHAGRRSGIGSLPRRQRFMAIPRSSTMLEEPARKRHQLLTRQQPYRDER